jgi:hypothetical protein
VPRAHLRASRARGRKNAKGDVRGIVLTHTDNWAFATSRSTGDVPTSLAGLQQGHLGIIDSMPVLDSTFRALWPSFGSGMG